MVTVGALGKSQYVETYELLNYSDRRAFRPIYTTEKLDMDPWKKIERTL